MKQFFLALSLAITPLTLLAEIQREWRPHSSPRIRSLDFEYSVRRLPLSGQVMDSTRLWSGDYWPTRRGLINVRWNTADQMGFRLVSPTREEASKMSESELATLAPSEKLDLLNGDYNYSLKTEVDEKAYRGAPEWYGLCHGWAPASINHREPTPKILVSNDGLRIPFGSSDIKALLSWYYAHHHQVESTRQVGKRCFFLNPGCSREDLNAGAFHIILSNSLGLRAESFVVDIEKSELVWNHPVVGFESTIVDDKVEPVEDSARGTVRRIRMKTKMTYVKENKVNTWGTLFGTTGQIYGQMKYEYYLDIDKNDRIIGGEWVSKDRPDFLWSMDRARSFGEKFARLPELLNE